MADRGAWSRSLLFVGLVAVQSCASASDDGSTHGRSHGPALRAPASVFPLASIVFREGDEVGNTAATVRTAPAVVPLADVAASERVGERENKVWLYEESSSVLADSPSSAVDSAKLQLPPTEPAAYVWWFLIFYMFYIMAAVCDEYLVPAVDIMCEKFDIPEDVAGATLMAFACNGPETLTNVGAIFITHSSVGMGTIVGSAVFNVMVIVGCCPIATVDGVLHVPAETFLRDCAFSAVSIVIVWWALPAVDLLRASVLFAMAGVYVLVVAKTKVWFAPAVCVDGLDEQLLNIEEAPDSPGLEKADDVLNEPPKNRSVSNMEESFFRDRTDSTPTSSHCDENTGTTPSAGTAAEARQARSKVKKRKTWPLPTNSSSKFRREKLREAYGLGPTNRAELWVSYLKQAGLMPHTEPPKREEGTSFCSTVSAWITFLLTAPTDLMLKATIPDVKLEERKHHYGPAFLLAMIWLASTSFVVCMGADAIHKFWGIPESFLGLTLISIGTSFPNLWASVITARQGRGPIAVSNAIGSNVQNIFLVLAGPIWVSVVLNGTYTMGGDDIMSSIVWMAVTLGVVVLVTAMSGFKLTKRAGVFFIVVYVVYIVQTTLSE